MDDLCYGLAIYCTPEEFDAYHANSGEDCHYLEMRSAVADRQFHGNSAFTPEDVVAHTHMHSDSTQEQTSEAVTISAAMEVDITEAPRQENY